MPSARGSHPQDVRPRRISFHQFVGASVITLLLLMTAFTASAQTDSPSGLVYGWGSNEWGELGLGYYGEVMTPVRLSLPTDIAMVATGAAHTLALRVDGTVWSWGENSWGEVGRDCDYYLDPSPQPIIGLHDVIAVAAGCGSSLAVTADGRVYAWGEAAAGQMDRRYPNPVEGIADVVAIATDEGGSLAVKSDGTVWAWGYNVHGRLGPAAAEYQATPIHVTGLPAVAAVETGYDFSIALARNGTVWTWGGNDHGQLGDGTTVSRAQPRLISRLKQAIAVSAGTRYVLAIGSDGSLWAWGENGAGQLGVGTRNDCSLPQRVEGLRDPVAVSAGHEHALACNSNGELWAWGSNSMGKLGLGHEPWLTTVPLRVAGIDRVISVAAGHEYSIAVREQTFHGLTVSIRGEGGGIVTVEPQGESHGFDDLVTLHAEPTEGWLFSGWQGLPPEVSDPGLQDVAFHIREDLQVVARFTPFRPTLTVNVVPRGAATVDRVPDKASYDYGETVTLTVRPSPGYGFIRWLADQYGIQGDAQATTIAITMTDDTMVTACLSSPPGVQDRGNVWTWTPVREGPQPEPVLVEGITDAVDVSVGGASVVAVRADGTVWAWGDNSMRQLGTGQRPYWLASPVQLPRLNNVVAVSMSDCHGVALKSDGTVWGWGSNWFGELGGEPEAAIRQLAAQVSGLDNIVAVRTSRNITFAIRRDGTLWACGQNSSGLLGDGTIDERVGPVRVGSLTGVKEVAVVQHGCIALLQDGTVWFWGSARSVSGLPVTAPMPLPLMNNTVALFRNGEVMALRADGAVVYYRSWELHDHIFVDPESEIQLLVSPLTTEFPRLPVRDTLSYRILPDGSLWHLVTMSGASGTRHSEMRRFPGLINVVAHSGGTSTHVAIADHVPNTMVVAPTIVGTGNWVYQNTPHTVDRGGHTVRMEVAILDGGGNTAFEMTTEKAAVSGQGEVMVIDDPEGNPLARLLAGSMRSDGRTGVGPLMLAVTVIGLNNGHSRRAVLPLTVRPLGDVSGNGGVEPGDLSLMIRALNRLPVAGCEPRAFDLDADGGTETSDRMLLMRILNGQTIP